MGGNGAQGGMGSGVCQLANMYEGSHVTVGLGLPPSRPPSLYLSFPPSIRESFVYLDHRGDT